MDVVLLLLNVVTIVFITTTMFAAGLGSTVNALTAVATDVPLLLLALLVNIGLVPLIAWALGILLHLNAAAFIALVLVAASPGGPFGAKLATMQHGDATTGAAMQVLLAAVGSVSFAPVANIVIRAAGIAEGFTLDVGALIRTVALLQLVPFAIGLLVRHTRPEIADRWQLRTAALSNATFLAVLAGMLAGNWQQIAALLGSRTILAGIVLTAATCVVGTLLATGPVPRRTTMGGVAATRNVGPALTAVGLAFHNDPAILGALAGIFVTSMVVSVPAAAVLGRRRHPPDAAEHSANEP
ncbi:bile acid:sodium symporter family protein [Dactylosporangium sp. CA-233914]|uniref:bile acid:sodium symporter family protein n=1 Tax=Dactylosporangium sp. CA-233914 TaxID=3239934 RepID=UPI003D91800B